MNHGWRLPEESRLPAAAFSLSLCTLISMTVKILSEMKQAIFSYVLDFLGTMKFAFSDIFTWFVEK